MDEGTMAFRGDAPSLDPLRCGISVCQPVYGSLLRYNSETEEFEPHVAESFESEDGKHWTLKLRDGVKFTDDTPFNADAVDFNWKRAKDPASLSAGAAYLARMTWKVVDELTIGVTLDEADYDFQWALIYELGMIGSPTAIKKLGDDFGSKPVGAGPFVVTERVPTSHVNCERNPDCWEEGLPYLDKLHVKTIQEDDQRANLISAPLDKAPDAVAPRDSDWRDESLGKYPKHDLAEAQRRFDAYLARTGQSSKLMMAGFPIMDRVADIAKAQFSKIEGLTVEVEKMQGATYLEGQRKGDFDITLTPAAGEMYGGTLYRYYHSEGDLDHWGYSNPKVDQALEQARGNTDKEKVMAALKTAGGEISKDAPVRLFVYETDHVATASNVHMEVPPIYLSALFTERVWIAD